MYNYYESVKNDIIEYLKYDYDLDTEKLEDDRDDYVRELYDDFWTVDSITGNSSGSYTFNSYRAKEYVLENIDLLIDACSEFCVDNAEIGHHFLYEDWEWMDVTIRCSILYECIENALDELEE